MARPVERLRWGQRCGGRSQPRGAGGDLDSPDQNTAEGRWYWGDYQEFGFDVTLLRASAEPTVYGVNVSALKTGSKGAQVRLFVDSLPAQVSAGDLDFGAGIKVNRIVSSGAGEVVAEVDVAPDAVFGKRDAKFGRSTLPNAIAVYDHVDYIKVTP